jgi:hypothetical protein
MKDLSEYDIFSWVVSSLATDSYEFNYRYKEVLNSDTYKFAPLFIQELAAKMMYSFAKDTNNIHKAAVEWLFEG